MADEVQESYRAKGQFRFRALLSLFGSHFLVNRILFGWDWDVLFRHHASASGSLHINLRSLHPQDAPPFGALSEMPVETSTIR